ncbi:MAG: hypothetical protein CME71_01025 [Halobacteriovorax sp.]|nr:hypothetical protein [Halobacteriovorax sp.]
MKANILILFMALMPLSAAQATLMLNVSILHHKGIDQGITLLSEFHSKEEVPPQKEVRIKMREGVEVLLMVDFKPEPEVYGPSAKLSVLGRVFTDAGKELSKIGEGSSVQVGENISFEVKDNIGQLIEVSLKPEFK